MLLLLCFKGFPACFFTLFQVVNGLTLPYCSDLVHLPENVNNSSIYNLCYSNDIFIYLVNVRTSLYYNFFLHSAVCDWNNTPDQHRNVEYMMAFKNVLSRENPEVPEHYLF